MAFKKIPLTIDTMIRNPVPVEGINQEDNVELNIVVTENKTPKDLSSQTIKVYVRRIDGTLVEQTDQITPTNASKGEVTVKLKNSAFNKEGYALFQLDVSDSSGRITSSYATFKIGKGLVSGEAIANTNEIEALKKVEEYIKKANQELETFKQTVAEINENEATRQENEVVRVREEASRNEAEAIRTQQEATRKEKENERVQAEIQRIADEEVRRENEALRGSKELERKQAEELRREKELLRIADENNRKVAEGKRIEAESVRVEAEKLRVVAETGRVEAESLRVTAEEERVAAETKRKESFNKFEGKINANIEELKNARSATTGERFDTLDERIDCEVDRLNKKIDVTMLQQEDKESHVVENTVEGMTTDMIIKGKTMYKKSDGTYTDTWEEGCILESFGEKEDKISILSSNSNLVKIAYKEEVNGSNGKFTESNIFFRTDFIKSNNKTYYLKTLENYIFTNIYLYDANKNYIGRGSFSSVDSLSPQSDYFILGGRKEDRSPLDSDFKKKICITESKIDEFIENIHNKKDILLQDLGFDEGLRGLNNSIYDELNDIRDVAIKRVGKYTFTGNETSIVKWVTVTDENFVGFCITNDDIPNLTSNRSLVVCNNFPSTDGVFNKRNMYIAGNRANICIEKSALTTPDIKGFKAWLKANPTTIYYELAEPVETPLSENINLKTFGEKTYVDFENSIKGTSSFKAPVNTLKTIARLSNENTRLKRDLALHAENTIATDEAITDYSLDMDYKLCLLEMELVEIKKKLGGK